MKGSYDSKDSDVQPDDTVTKLFPNQLEVVGISISFLENPEYMENYFHGQH